MTKMCFSAEDCIKLANNYKNNLIVFRGKLYDKEEFVLLIKNITKKNINTNELYVAIHDAINFKHRAI